MKELKINTIAGREYILKPVPMRRMPSQDSTTWLKFQKMHVPGTTLSDSEMTSIQRYMIEHKTEALTDGVNNYTLAGGMLAYCEPSVVV